MQRLEPAEDAGGLFRWARGTGYDLQNVPGGAIPRRPVPARRLLRTNVEPGALLRLFSPGGRMRFVGIGLFEFLVFGLVQ